MWQRKSKTPSSSSKASKFSKSLEQTQSFVGRFYAPEYEMEEIRTSEVVNAKKLHWWEDDYVPLPDEAHPIKVRTLGAIVKPKRSQTQNPSQVHSQVSASTKSMASPQAKADSQTSALGADELNFMGYARGNSRYQSELQAAKARKQQRLQQMQQAQLSKQEQTAQSSLQEPSIQNSALDGVNLENAAAQTEEVVAELHDALLDERLAEAKALVQNTSYQERLKRHQKRQQPNTLHDLSLEHDSYAEFVAKYRAKMQGAVAPDSYAEQVKFMQQVASERTRQDSSDNETFQAQALDQCATSAQEVISTQVQAATFATAQAGSLSPAQILELKKREQRWEESGMTRLEAAEFGGQSLSKIDGGANNALGQTLAQSNLQGQAAHTAPQRESARDIIRRKMAALRLHSEAQKLARQAQMLNGDMESGGNFEDPHAEASGDEIEDTLNLSGRWWKQRRGLGTNLHPAAASSRSRMGTRANSRFNSANSISKRYEGATDYAPESAMEVSIETAIESAHTIESAADKNRRAPTRGHSAWKQRTSGMGKAQGQGENLAGQRSLVPVQPVALDADEASASFGNYFDYGRKFAAKDADSMTSFFGNYHEDEQRLEDAESTDEVVSSFGSCFDPPAYTSKRTQRTQRTLRQLQAHSKDEAVASFGAVLTSASCSNVDSSSSSNSGARRGKGQYKRGSRAVIHDAESAVASFGSIGSSNRGSVGARGSKLAEVETAAAHQAETAETAWSAETDEIPEVNQAGNTRAKGAGNAGKGRTTGKAKAELPEDVQAFNAIVQMLTRREHSQVEIRQKLKGRFSAEALEIALQRCVNCGYQSDARHAEMLVRHMEFSGYGPQKLWVEAKRKGADEDEIKRLASEVDWDLLAYKVLTGRYSAEQMQDYATRNKALAFLARRGFSLSSGYAALQRLQNCSENE